MLVSQNQEDEFITSLKSIPTTYCDWSVSLLIEYAARKHFRIAKKMNLLSSSRALLSRIKGLLRQRRSVATEDLWKTGDIVLLPSIENHLKHMIPLAESLSNKMASVSWLIKINSFPFEKKVGSHLFWLETQGVLEDREQQIAEDFSQALRKTSLQLQLPLLARIYLWLTLRDEGYRTIYVMQKTRQQIIAKRPSAFIAGRPKNIHPLAIIAVAKSLEIPTFFLSHTTWFEYAYDKPQLYDLTCFDHALVFSSRCKEFAESRNSAIQIKICGLPEMIQSSRVDSQDKELLVGYPAGKDYQNITEISQATDLPSIRLVIKGHPPSGDKEKLQTAVASRRANASVYEHADIDLAKFISAVDIMVCGKSNVAFESAQSGVPVIFYLCNNEKNISKLRKRSIEPENIAVLHANDASQLSTALKNIAENKNHLLSALQAKQSKIYSTLFERISIEEKAAYILENSKYTGS